MTMSFASPSPPKRRQSRDVSQQIKEISKRSKLPGVSTPFNTPYRSRNQTCIPDTNDTQIKRAVKKLKCLVSKLWHVYHVSPLFNWDYSEVSMKRYARVLKEKLMARISDQSTAEYNVSYSLVPNLQLNETDHKAFEVTVVKISEKGVRSLAYNAILLSWGASDNTHIGNSTFLPILLCHGYKAVMKQIHTEFQLLHDCFISPFDMQDEELRTLTVGIFASSSYKDKEDIKIKYSLPQKRKSGVLDISLPTNILSNLWAGIHGSASKHWNDEEVSTFWNELHHHAMRSVGLELGHCGLAKVILPDIAFTQETVFVKKRELMCLVLCFLMSLDTTLSTVAPNVHEVVVPD